MGAPYSATITNESVQSLADGNRIVQNTSGTIARDSQGRTRQDAPLPAIGNLSAANAPHLVFIHDPVAQTSYTLNLTDKVAQKMPMPPWWARRPMTAGVAGRYKREPVRRTGPGDPDAVTVGAAPAAAARRHAASNDTKVLVGDRRPGSTEDLGSQTMAGVLVNGMRTTRTIPAGQIGNDRPIRSSPRSGRRPNFRPSSTASAATRAWATKHFS